MIKKSSRLLALLLCGAMLIQGLAILPLAEETAQVSEQTVDCYGRQALSELSNAEALLYAYDQIVAGVAVSSERVSVYNGTVITPTEVQTVVDAYRKDHPEHFWLGNSYSIRGTVVGDTVTASSIVFSYLLSGDSLAAAQAAFESAVSDMLSGITGAMTDYEKELAIHDRLAQAVTYAGGTNAYNAYGALVEGTAVCEGYAKAFQYLLQRAGIQSFIVEGSNRSTQEAHAWNIVRIHGEYYHTDLTWDDQTSHTYHAYFNLSDAAIEEDHVITVPNYALPVCDSEADSYFTVAGGKLTEYTVEQVAAVLKAQHMTASVYLRTDVDKFIAWYKTNIRAIVQKAGVSGSYSYSYSKLGREVVLRITGSQISTTDVPGKAATCTAPGYTAGVYCNVCNTFISGHMVIPATGHEYGSGGAMPTCTEAGYTTFTCLHCNDSFTETTPAVGHSYENGTCTACGQSQVEAMDLSGDGKVTAFDAQLLLEVEKGLRTLTPEQQLGVGNTTAEDTIDYILGET